MNGTRIVARSLMASLLLALVSLAVVSTDLAAQDKPVPKASIDGLQIGAHWSGPAIDKKSLLGKVVLVEIWGQ